MDQTRTREPRYGTTDIPGAAPLVPAAGTTKRLGTRMVHASLRWLKSAALALGVVYVVGWIALIVGVPALNRMTWRPPFIGNTINKRIGAKAMLPFAFPRDPSVSPEQAGLAFFSMEPEPKRRSGGFMIRQVEKRPDVPWRHFDLSPLAFRSGNSNSYNGPDPRTILQAVHKGLTRDELSTLRLYGTAEVWKAFDRVARASNVDMIAGRLELPFGPDATPWALPISSFAATKELAYASVARAAWHLAEGRRDSAEAALRAVVSVGFQLVDHGTSLFDELIGDVMVGVGRDGLKHLFEVTKDPRLAQVVAAAKRADDLNHAPAMLPWTGAASRAEAEQALINFATRPGDATVPERVTALYAIPRMTCASTRDLVMGPSAGMRAAFDAVRRDYARLPGQRAELDLIESQLTRPTSLASSGLPLPTGVARAGDLISRVYFNPRLGTCAALSGVP